MQEMSKKDEMQLKREIKLRKHRKEKGNWGDFVKKSEGVEEKSKGEEMPKKKR